MDDSPLMSIQPYFVLDADDFCQRVLFENGISHFFSFSNKTQEDITVPLLTDGCSNLLFEYRNGSVRTHFVGSTMEKRTFSVKKGAEYFGVRLAPGCAFALPGVPAKETIGKVFILDELDFSRDFCAVMGQQKDFDSRIKTFLQEFPFLCGAGKRPGEKQKLFNQISEIIIRHKGMVKVKDLEKLSGYTSRYINKIFEQEVGFSVKQMCSTVKRQFLLGDIHSGKADSLTEIASEYDFYDQSHFIREFKDFTGTTLSQYAKVIEEKKYSDNVRNV